MALSASPAIDWETLHMEDDNVLLHLMAGDPRLHLLVIPRDVLEDAVAIIYLTKHEAERIQRGTGRHSGRILNDHGDARGFRCGFGLR